MDHARGHRLFDAIDEGSETYGLPTTLTSRCRSGIVARSSGWAAIASALSSPRSQSRIATSGAFASTRASAALERVHEPPVLIRPRRAG
jgi:hypothetical protein